MINVSIRILGIKVAEVVLEGSDDIEDEFAALIAADEEAAEEGQA